MRDKEKSTKLALELAKQAEIQDDPQATANSLQYMARSLFRVESYPEAETMLRRAVEIMQEHQPGDWLTSAYQVFLGQALLKQEEYDEAETLLIAGYEVLPKALSQSGPLPSLRSKLCSFCVVFVVRLTSLPPGEVITR